MKREESPLLIEAKKVQSWFLKIHIDCTLKEAIIIVMEES